ncbi:MAG TPA: hypothetical protein DD636_01670 [Anaerolineaceae bacterium]|nr:hypothetical protein [Anaerolineaceae bacterium]
MIDTTQPTKNQLLSPSGLTDPLLRGGGKHVDISRIILGSTLTRAGIQPDIQEDRLTAFTEWVIILGVKRALLATSANSWARSGDLRQQRVYCREICHDLPKKDSQDP